MVLVRRRACPKLGAWASAAPRGSRWAAPSTNGQIYLPQGWKEPATTPGTSVQRLFSAGVVTQPVSADPAAMYDPR